MSRWAILLGGLALGVLGACSSDADPPVDSGVPSNDATADTTPDSGVTGARCTEAGEQLLTPIDSVSTGVVAILSDAQGTKTLYVDATAGGTAAQATNPRIYVNLATGTRVDVTDKSAAASSSWDLAIKRPILYSNSGDGGSGQGGARFLAGRDFASVTASDAATATFVRESFFEADCSPRVDQTGTVLTSFDGWYAYDGATNTLAPTEGTWLVKGGTGKVFKLRITSYYATPDGGVGQFGGRYTLDVGAL
jgi:hypothetical protein